MLKDKKTALAATLLTLALACAQNEAGANTSEGYEKGEFQTWKIKLTAEERLRQEYRNDFDLNSRAKDNGNVFFNRLKTGIAGSFSDEYLNEKAGFLIEALDARAASHNWKAGTVTSGQKDEFDLHQAYLNYNGILDGPLNIKIGRQEIKYGKGRMIAAPSWSNKVRSFDAMVLGLKDDSAFLDLFYAQDVKYNEHNFNRSTEEEYLLGVYAGRQKDKVSPLTEVYFLDQNIHPKGFVATKRYTAGIRANAILPGHIVCEIEAPYQFGTLGGGTSGSKDIRAYAFHFDLSREFADLIYSPKLNLEFNLASGDNNPSDSVSNTFIPLYQSTHEPYGLIDLFRWQNMRELALSSPLSLSDKLQIIPQINFFWLDSKCDSWYNSSGTSLRKKTSGKRDSHIGNELSLRCLYEFNKQIKFEAGYAHFFCGRYTKDTGNDDDVDWLYTQLTLKY